MVIEGGCSGEVWLCQNNIRKKTKKKCSFCLRNAMSCQGSFENNVDRGVLSVSPLFPHFCTEQLQCTRVRRERKSRPLYTSDVYVTGMSEQLLFFSL